MKKPLLSELTLREKIGQTTLGKPMNKNLLEPAKYPYGDIWTLGNIDMGVINMADRRGEEVQGDRRKSEKDRCNQRIRRIKE